MMGRMAISRRRLLSLLVSGVVAGLAGRRFAIPGELAHERLQVILGRVFFEQDSARRIGLAYLGQFPHELDARRLPAMLFGDAAWGAWPAGKLQAEIGNRVRSDFVAGNTVRIHGWCLSRSEARVCALLALS
jgi:hypothetical protein